MDYFKDNLQKFDWSAQLLQSQPCLTLMPHPKTHWKLLTYNQNLMEILLPLPTVDKIVQTSLHN